MAKIAPVRAKMEAASRLVDLAAVVKARVVDSGIQVDPARVAAADTRADLAQVVVLAIRVARAEVAAIGHPAVRAEAVAIGHTVVKVEAAAIGHLVVKVEPAAVDDPLAAAALAAADLVLDRGLVVARVELAVPGLRVEDAARHRRRAPSQRHRGINVRIGIGAGIAKGLLGMKALMRQSCNAQSGVVAAIGK